MFAAEDLQSRLYNLVRLRPSEVLDQDEYRAFALETLYLLAQYFYYEPLVLQYTPYGRDPYLIRLVQRVRGRLAAAASRADVDPWCLFRPRQRAIGRAVADSKATTKNPSVMSLTEFEQVLDTGILTSLGIKSAVQNFTESGQLDKRSSDRLAALQANLIELLEYLERELVKKQTPWYQFRKRRELADFSLFVGDRSGGRRRASPPPTTYSESSPRPQEIMTPM